MDDKIRIYTKTGDAGETSLCDGSRTAKDSIRVEAYGCIDELSSFLMLCRTKLEKSEIRHHLLQIQKDLFEISANLAFPATLSQASIRGTPISRLIPRIDEEAVKRLERWIDHYEERLPNLSHFILMAGSEKSAQLHVARTICRRAERRVVTLKQHEEIDKQILKYLNRLSDYLFTAARLVSQESGGKDIEWFLKR